MAYFFGPAGRPGHSTVLYPTSQWRVLCSPRLEAIGMGGRQGRGSSNHRGLDFALYSLWDGRATTIASGSFASQPTRCSNELREDYSGSH